MSSIHLNTNQIHNTALFFILAAPFTIFYYAIYVFNPANAGNIYLYVLQVFADVIAIAVVSSLWITILLDLIQPEHSKRKIVHNVSWIKENNITVDVYVPIAHEAFDVVIKTITKAMQMDYPHTTYVLDDGHSTKVKEFCQSNEIVYLQRGARNKKFAKSGNLNYGLSHGKADYFAVFDADHVPKKDFLTQLLPFFENDKVALVQTPQFYENTEKFIPSGTAQAQEIFYQYIQPAKNSYNASFCCGTNMIYRRSAIDEIGGIASLDHSEDIWTTILLHEKGFESVFFNKILAIGQAPETISSFFRQQNRWARGGFSLFFLRNPLFSTKFTFDQRLQYFFSNLHYFSAFTILIYLLLPIIYLLFDLHPMDILHNSGWLIHYVPYFLTVFLLPLFLLRKFKLATICISIASFAPYLNAFVASAFQQNYKWSSTGSGGSRYSPVMLSVFPHVFIVLLSFLAIIVGWYNPTDVVTTAVTTFWVLINAYFLIVFLVKGILKK